MNLVQLVGIVLFGLILALIFNINGIQNSNWYQLLIALLLATGLYASTYGIDLKEAKQHLKLILSAVTIGVFLKAAIIGVTLWLAFQDPFFLILGIVVAQIDPLSVSALLQDNRMSKKAKAILSSWASFDDPMTVILAIYAPIIIVQVFGSGAINLSTTDASVGLWSYITELGLNLGLAAQAFCLYTVIRFYSKQVSAWLAFGVSLLVYVLLAIAFSISVIYFMMLGVALIGLFLRPPIEKYINLATKYALVIATLLLGILLVGGVNIVAGIALGFMAYLAQIIVGFILTRKLPKKDSWHIAFAQQNGITAIILALVFEPLHSGTVAIVAPAILVVNCLHYIINMVLDKHVLSKI
ncbi:MAG TPA: cation:proton antiporter [Candidatus Saccharimonadales bacterium]|nr:cation:proton antiporter [Candidatus Saccharimonadales bacterium]